MCFLRARAGSPRCQQSRSPQLVRPPPDVEPLARSECCGLQSHVSSSGSVSGDAWLTKQTRTEWGVRDPTSCVVQNFLPGKDSSPTQQHAVETVSIHRRHVPLQVSRPAQIRSHPGRRLSAAGLGSGRRLSELHEGSDSRSSRPAWVKGFGSGWFSLCD